MYTDPTHTIRKTGVSPCFPVLISRVGIQHEQIGRMMGSIVLPCLQGIFWHLPTSDQHGFAQEVVLLQPDFFSDSPGENYQMALVGPVCLTFLLEARTPWL